jgi:predicted nucleic acid-binding protein
VNGFLLDTNIPSESTNPRPEPKVIGWLRTQSDVSLYLSAISVGELRKGITLLDPGRRRHELEIWLNRDLLLGFRDRILPVTSSIADRWGLLDANRQRRGSPLGTPDGLIAATALEHNLTLVTRNVKDFVHLGVPLFNPWEL